MKTLVLTSLLAGLASVAGAGTYFVAPGGADVAGGGTADAPWATLGFAVENIPDDGSTVLVGDGTYDGRIRMDRRFTQRATFRAANPYRARLIQSTDDSIVTIFGGANFTVEGFELTRPPGATGFFTMQVQEGAEDITLRNNIFHDSLNNDVLKINNVAARIIVEGNVFYNQSGSDEHMDVNGVTDIVIRDNIFFNDFAGSGRPNTNETSSFVVIKNSDDSNPRTKRIAVRRNVFLNWEGSVGSNFLLLGEDGNPYYEAQAVLIENNLMIGNAANTMRSAFGVKGGRRILFRNNTVAGDLPSNAFAMRLNLEGDNPVNDDITFVNDVWSDPTGTMDDFSDGDPAESQNLTLRRNLYWNGGNPIPTDGDVLNVTADPEAVIADPLLGGQASVVLPRWDAGAGRFVSGSATIREEFERLVALYGTPAAGSPVIGAADPASAPGDDILGNARDASPDLGAVEVGSTTRTLCAGQPVTVAGRTPGDDVIRGTFAADVIGGGPGADLLVGRAGADLLCGGGGADTVNGGAGRDTLRGNRGQDTLNGGGAADDCGDPNPGTSISGCP